ncbi:unnamed protein product [Symbiodinium sp. CCMP2592]|nr:unnamed protein product [Symbiodinium sp. CCMP2592]CAE7472832.1 unnamed protein product [Symbiodinium sp. CCMP2592]CAE7697101.1 unnamed protein product [Symbiodinium sp. CCMP2592]
MASKQTAEQPIKEKSQDFEQMQNELPMDSQVLLHYDEDADTGEDSQIPETLQDMEGVLYRPGWKNLMVSMQDKQAPEIHGTGTQSTLPPVLQTDETTAPAKKKARLLAPDQSSG